MNKIKLWKCKIIGCDPINFYVIDHLGYPLINNDGGMVYFQEVDKDGNFIKWIYIPYSEIMRLECYEVDNESNKT